MFQRVFRATDLGSAPPPTQVSVGRRQGCLVQNWSPWWLQATVGALQLAVIPAWHSGRFRVPESSRDFILGPYQIETGAVEGLDFPEAPHGVWADSDMLVEREETVPLAGLGAGTAVIPGTGTPSTPYSGTSSVAITTATTTVVKNGPGVVGTLSNASGAITGAVTVYDNTAATGKVVWSGTLAAGQVLPLGVPCGTGITVVTAAADAIAVSFA